MTITNVKEALPEGFAFYSMGMLEIAPAAAEGAEMLPDEALSELALVAFRYSGDVRGVIITAFDRGLDASMYTEMGNILASRFADRLAALEDGIGISISPPLLLETGQFRKMLQAAAPLKAERTYHHLSGNTTVPVRMLVLPDASRAGALDV